MQIGGGPNVSNSYIINGLPGPLCNCSSKKDTFVMGIVPGKTYMLRIVNSALNDELGIANHTMTAVEIDVIYTKTLSTNVILIAPKQTTNMLVKAKNDAGILGKQFFLTARLYVLSIVAFDNSIIASIVVYHKDSNVIPQALQKQVNIAPSASVMSSLLAINATNFATKFTKILTQKEQVDFFF